MSWPWNMSERKAILVGICLNFVSSICILQYNIEGKTLPSPKNKTKQKQNKWIKRNKDLNKIYFIYQQTNNEK